MSNGTLTDVEGLLGRWFSEGSEFVLAWRSGQLEARMVAAPASKAPAVFERLSDDMWRTVSGREQGEPLRVVRAEGGSVTKLYWATYPFVRPAQGFSPR